MADLVSEGSEFSCNFCTSKLKLSVITSSSTGDAKKLANQANCFLPPPGGNCTLLPGPPPPCAGVPPGMVADTGQTTVKVDGQTALGEGCKFMCPLGQPVTLSKAGQEVAKHDEASTSASAFLIAGTTMALRAPHPYLKIGLEAGVLVVAGAMAVSAVVKDIKKSFSGAKAKASTAAPPPGEDPEKDSKSHTKRKIERYKKNIDSQKEHITRRDLDAARRELDGEVVKLKDSGKPFDHVHEVRDAQNGLRNTIESIKKDLTNPLNSAEKQQLENLLSEASKLLDYTKGFVP